jgi:hypothetical protein
VSCFFDGKGLQLIQVVYQDEKPSYNVGLKYSEIKTSQIFSMSSGSMHTTSR